MLGEIVEWVKTNGQIPLALLSGSRASGQIDELSDYDISFFAGEFPFIDNDNWLAGISPHALCIHDSFPCEDENIPTRLVIFNSGIKADFSFYPLRLLNKMIADAVLFPGFDLGYHVLWDSNKLVQKLPGPQHKAYLISKPPEHDFGVCINEFWFEAYHVAKYLKRADRWTALSRTCAMRPWILKMLQWQAAVNTNFQLRVKPEGRGIEGWISEQDRDMLSLLFFNSLDTDDMKKLLKTINWFENITVHTAKAMSYDSKENMVRRMKEIIRNITD